MPFQLEPALALTRGRSCRFLIADAVGLGKTIQAGLMIAETLERLPGSRVLVVTPAGLREQWVEELGERFRLEPQVLDAQHAARAAAELSEGVNPWTVDPLVVTSIDYIKRADVIRSLEALLWDLVVFDEAHALAGRSDRAAAAGALAQRARSVVMLTATPNSGDEDAFRKLCALGELSDGMPLITFRRTRDQLGPRSPRRQRVLRIHPTADETAMHVALAEYTALAAQQSEIPAAHLAMAVLERRAASSAASLATSLERRITLLADTQAPVGPQMILPFPDSGDDAAPGHELWAPALHDRREEIAQLEHLLQLARSAARRESKMAVLARLLRRVDEPAIVFTEYRDTLSTVGSTIGRPATELHGGMSAAERRDSARRFTHGDARLLLATDAASEGLNLHHRCRLVINLEMPWTPVRIEQRIGRVDRIGQARTVHAVALVAAGTSEEALTARVAQRSAAASSIAHDTSAEQTADAANECRRLEMARLLADGASPPADWRPLVAVGGRRTRSMCWGMRVSLADSNDLVVWESLLGLSSPTSLLDRTQAAALLRAFTELPGLSAELAAVMADATTGFQRDIAPFLTRSERRERAILGALRTHRARLSASLLQRGLFDRRHERATSAQARLLDEADAECAARLMLLDRLRRANAVQARPIFGLARR